MDWSSSNSRMPFFSRPENSNFTYLYNYNYDQFQGLEMKQPLMQEQAMVPTLVDKNNINITTSNFYGHDSKKKRLSSEQLESLENSFQEDIKLEPDRKMKLAKELGLQPRQIAIWFQNRRARWKGKQLEHLYDALKREYDTVSREKNKLQQEVMALRAIVKEQGVVGTNKQLVVSSSSRGGRLITRENISGEETVDDHNTTTTTPPHDMMVSRRPNNIINYAALNNVDIMNDYNNSVMMMPPYWHAPPS